MQMILEASSGEDSLNVAGLHNFQVSTQTLTRSLKSIESCSLNETGVVTTFVIPGSEECTREKLRTALTKNIFLSVEDDCNFDSGKLNFFKAKAALEQASVSH